MELLQLLTDNLGVSQEQAQGGAGLLFQLAKDKLGSGDFQQVANAVPGIDDLMDKAPGSGPMGALGGLASSIGGGSLGNLAGLAAGFSQLKLDSGMITKFVPVILSFVQSKGGDGVKDLLASVFK
jgi:hypothetical protein